MDTAFFRYEPKASMETDSYATNGACFLYNPVHVLKSYRLERERPVRSFLHMVLHCVFCHPFVASTINRPCWDLACDIAVEYTISTMNIQVAATSNQTEQDIAFAQLQQNMKMLTAEHIYYFLAGGSLSETEFDKLFRLFREDDHRLWYEKEPYSNQSLTASKTDNDCNSSKSSDRYDESSSESDNSENGDSSKVNESKSGSDSKSSGSDDTSEGTDSKSNPDPKNGGGNDTSDSDSKSSSGSKNGEGDDTSKGSDNNNGSDSEESTEGSPSKGGENRESSSSQILSEAEQIWREVAHRIQVNVETFQQNQGNHAGGMSQNLREVNRERYDYTSFLKKFAVLGEAMKINEDEFDYVFYTYGLQLYKRMPLIEPLEYKEVKRIKEFVIAIDTSGSVSGELVQKFVQKTYNILLSTESFFSKINVHIIQCDADIQEDKKITCREEFDEYLKSMRILGLGGTDFRPVFEYVNQLQAEKEFTNLKGLIYFTDGYGDFPSQKPTYDTAFVFIDNEYNNPDIPPWAIKLVLKKEEI